ncbi:MAG: hypothetical protein A3I92_00540 [Candidatus Yanofskybacteria bacterium RIFCSPLOWO2_02_FULL_43_10b]|uniref:Uncharacterized protein n=1 Tax=Candidatus Yanofskybacteria bacterium RIFCSPLOWO2_02_FULL_43_10b TaxID=1802704 RepID=A0A1F8H1K2_9BACT|nr:MAG: hypothetical protein A3I92_00540 [Candidatus Yanofskybacteria bacterium RIFCSPLOWO2_02_FULL_43_10b]
MCAKINKKINKSRFDLESLKRLNLDLVKPSLVTKSAMAAIFLFNLLFGFNAAGMLKNLTNPNAFVSPLFTLSREESPPVGLLRKMYTPEPSYVENYSKLFVGEVR